MKTGRAHRGSRTTRLTKYTKPLSTSLPPPLTPPSSERGSSTQKPRAVLRDIIREIENRKAGRGFSDAPWLCFELPPAEYKCWERRYQNDGFVQDKLRYDYFPSISRFVLRMPRLLHDQLTASVAEDLKWQLKSIASGAGPAASFALEIVNTNTTTIEFDSRRYAKHSPDSSLKHIDAQYPGVVMEVSYSQKRKDLQALARDYIRGSEASIQVVIGIDLEYTGRKATLTVWRPQMRVRDSGKERLVEHRTLWNQEIRSENGVPNNDIQNGLRLHLKDFGPIQLAAQAATLDEQLFISFATLSGYISVAERADSKFRRRTGVRVQSTAVADRVEMESEDDISSQESTLPDDLDDDDERRYQREDERDEERAERGDPSYPA